MYTFISTHLDTFQWIKNVSEYSNKIMLVTFVGILVVGLFNVTLHVPSVQLPDLELS
jgi:uncharacterized membrane protein YiaA